MTQPINESKVLVKQLLLSRINLIINPLSYGFPMISRCQLPSSHPPIPYVPPAPPVAPRPRCFAAPWPWPAQPRRRWRLRRAVRWPPVGRWRLRGRWRQRPWAPTCACPWGVARLQLMGSNWGGAPCEARRYTKHYIYMCVCEENPHNPKLTYSTLSTFKKIKTHKHASSYMVIPACDNG